METNLFDEESEVTGIIYDEPNLVMANASGNLLFTNLK